MKSDEAERGRRTVSPTRTTPGVRLPPATETSLRSAVMGAGQLAGVMVMIQQVAAMKAGKPLPPEQLKATQDHLVKEVEKQSSAWFATGQLWDDGIIDPRQTRNFLGFSLAVVNNTQIQGTKEFGVFRM